MDETTTAPGTVDPMRAGLAQGAEASRSHAVTARVTEPAHLGAVSAPGAVTWTPPKAGPGE